MEFLPIILLLIIFCILIFLIVSDKPAKVSSKKKQKFFEHLKKEMDSFGLKISSNDMKKNKEDYDYIITCDATPFAIIRLENKMKKIKYKENRLFVYRISKNYDFLELKEYLLEKITLSNPTL